MSLGPGSLLGHFEIVEKIGAGGMGEVWSAKDTRLERQVAVKVLPPGFAVSGETRARFEREAKTISSLNHPNICTLYDVGREGDVDYLVMELIEGESLAKRLAAGPMPLTDVLRYGAQIADALDCAHRKNIVHRDLKPGNVMLTKSGAKLLDFGLARVAREVGPMVGASLAETQAQPLTAEGSIVGTFQYMSPEQLEGREEGARTDIFALGALLYEMATGHRAFQGDTRSSLIAAIVSSRLPPLSSVVPVAPPAFEYVLEKCLEKDAEGRWQSAHDVASQLRWIGSGVSQDGVAKAVISSHRLRRRALLALATTGWLVALVIIAWLGSSILKGESESEPVARMYSWPVRGLAQSEISPDGQWLAFVAGGYVHFRRIDQPGIRRLDDSRGAGDIAWSPDGSSIAYIAHRNSDGNPLSVPEVRRAEVDGLVSTTISRIENANSLSFGPENRIFIGTIEEERSGIVSIPFGGGEPTSYLGNDGESTMIFGGGGFFFLPGSGKLVCVAQEDGRRSIAVHDGELGFRTIISASKDGFIGNPVYSAATGHLLYNLQDSDSANPSIWAVPIDAADGVALGPAQLVADLAVGPSVAGDGSLYFVRATAEFGPAQLVWVDREGNIGESIGQAQPALTSPALSPDGRQVAVSGKADDDTQDIWLHDVNRGIKTRLSYGVVGTWRPTWSPDGQQLAFQSRDRKEWGRADIYVQDTDGRASPVPLVATELNEQHPDWSPDGNHIIYTVTKEDGDKDLWVVEVHGESEPRPFLASSFDESMPFLSPDGHYVAYESVRTGQSEIFVTTFPDPGREWRVSTDGGSYPQWGSNEIFYIDYDTQRFMAVEVRTDPDLELGDPVALFASRETDLVMHRRNTFDYAITPSGDQFIFVRDLSKKKYREIAVMQNWTGRLAER